MKYPESQLIVALNLVSNAFLLIKERLSICKVTELKHRCGLRHAQSIDHKLENSMRTTVGAVNEQPEIAKQHKMSPHFLGSWIREGAFLHGENDFLRKYGCLAQTSLKSTFVHLPEIRSF